MYYGRRSRDDDDEHHNYPLQEPTFTRPVVMASPTAKANIEIGRLIDRRRYSEVFALVTAMKEANVPPDPITYDHLLSLCAKIHAPVEAWAIFEDMLALGFSPERTTFHHLIRVR